MSPEVIMGGLSLLVTILLAVLGFGFRYVVQSAEKSTEASVAIKNIDSQMDMATSEHVATRRSITKCYDRIETVKDDVADIKSDLSFVKGKLESQT